jgi:hypothetical protein
MFKINLQYNKGFKWNHSENIHSKGYLFDEKDNLTNNYMFSYHFMSKHWKYIYFRENEIGYTIKDTYVDQEKFFLRSVGTTKSGELISWFSPDEVKRLEEAQVVTQKLDDITLDSNPVLCFISKIILHEKE